MSALFVTPLSFTAASTSPTPLLGTVANLANDVPGLAWTFGLTTPYLIVDLGVNAVSYDTIALVGSNLRSTDTVQIRTGTTSTGIGNYAGTASAAWTGTKPSVAKAMSIYQLGTARTERYVRIDLSAPSHPDGQVQFWRLVIGKAVTTAGVNYDAEIGFQDQSIITTGPGYRSVDEYDVFVSWKFRTDYISEALWRSDWNPMLRTVGNRRGVLFVADDQHPEYFQTDAIFGCLTSNASGKRSGYNAWALEATVTALAA